MTCQRERVLFAASVSLFVPLFAAGCSESETTDPSATPTEGARYVLASSVFGDNSATTYVSYMTSLDVDHVDIKDAHEFPGFATIATVDGMLFVADGEAPTLTRFSRDSTGKLAQDDRLSFLEVGVQSAALFGNYFASGTKAYMPKSSSTRVIWNPSTLEIEGELDISGPPAERDGLVLRAGFDRALGVRDGRLFSTLYWSDDVYYEFAPTSQIAVLDPASDEVRALLEAPCPGLDVATQDEQGNLYFSNWVFSIAGPLFDEAAPKNCMVQIPAGSETIDEGATRDLSELVEGRQTAAFRYVADGVALLAVFYDDRLTADVLPANAANTPNWRLYRVNTDQWTAEPIEGLDFFSGGYYSFRLDGRTFVLLPSADYATTTAYEIGAEGPAEERFSVTGWVYQMADLD